jgi:hypothetical protein
MKNNILELAKTTEDCAKYTGTVTVSTYLGDRLIHTETHHNKGLERLFKFVSTCLQGNWYEAKFHRPCKLVLLKTAAGEQLVENEAAPTGTAALSTPLTKPEYWSSVYAVCNPVMYDTAAVAELNEDSDGPESSVTYHFRIPFLSLVSGSKIQKLLLLPATTSNYAAEACAYYILKEPLEVPVAGGNFTIIIDWTLTFKN